MGTLAWIAGCFLIGCSSTPMRSSDAGNLSNSDGGGDGGNNSDGGTDGGTGGGLTLIYGQSFAGTDGSDWPASRAAVDDAPILIRCVMAMKLELRLLARARQEDTNTPAAGINLSV